jgi:hypothetical protein
VTTSDDDFVALLPKLMALYPDAPSMKLRDEHRQVGHVAHGWFMRVQRGIEALMLLDEQGFGAEAAPLRRSMIEHTVGLRWLAQEGDSVKDTLINAAANQAENRKKSLFAAGWSQVDWATFDAVIADSEGRDTSRNNEVWFTTRCRKAGDAHGLAMWHMETASSDPSWQSAAGYVDWDPATTTMTLRGQAECGVHALSFAVTHLLQALHALNDITRGKPFNKRLQALTRESNAAVEKRWTETGVPMPVLPAVSDNSQRPDAPHAIDLG